MSLVAVITDFGRRDPYVAEMTLALRREGPPGMTLVEVTHDLEPGAVAAGAWLCGRIWTQLPPGGVLLAVVDPGVGSARPAVAARAGGRFFVGPGNGLAAHLAAAADLEVVRLTLRAPPPGLAPSSTFEGRDVFAPAAARLAGSAALDSLGTPGRAADLGRSSPPVGAANVVWIDRFGNLITDLPRQGEVGDRLSTGVRLQVAGQTVRGPVRSYTEATAGELVWYWGSGGTLEIALDRDSAARRLSARVGLVIPLPAP